MVLFKMEPLLQRAPQCMGCKTQWVKSLTAISPHQVQVQAYGFLIVPLPVTLCLLSHP